MSESSKTQLKFTKILPRDVVGHIISTFLPIQYVLRHRVLSKEFRKMEIRSRDLDFIRIFSKKCIQYEDVRIIDDIFNRHQGPKINRFVLFLNDIGVEDKIHSWMTMCLGKKIQELVLDFSKSKKAMEMTIDFSAIETLLVLKLH